MSWLNAHRVAANSKSDYATSEDFRKLFTNDVKRLYLLSFFLTANHEKAEQCFVAGLDDCVNGNPVFREWADAWARRVIVRNAVGMIQPRPGNTAPRTCAFRSADEGTLPRIVLHDARFTRVLALEDFERFVFVLSVLEGYPDQGCAILLGASRQEIREARVHAVDHMADFDTEGVIPAACSMAHA